ncbi:hypothetical protein V2J09_013200 [Rumex salicifolius]
MQLHVVVNKRLSQPLSCNFVLNPSHTIAEHGVPIPSPIPSPTAHPLPSETAAQEIQHEVTFDRNRLLLSKHQKLFMNTLMALGQVFLRNLSARRHISNVLKPHYKKGTTPFFIKVELWQRMLTYKRADIKMVKQSNANKKNRGLKKSLEGWPYRGGSRKAEFDQLVGENPSPEPISRTKDIEVWMQASNVPHNGRIFGLGEERVGLVRSGIINNPNDTPCSSSINAQEYMEPFKEEIREVWDQMKSPIPKQDAKGYARVFDTTNSRRHSTFRLYPRTVNEHN